MDSNGAPDIITARAEAVDRGCLHRENDGLVKSHSMFTPHDLLSQPGPL